MTDSLNPILPEGSEADPVSYSHPQSLSLPSIPLMTVGFPKPRLSRNSWELSGIETFGKTVFARHEAPGDLEPFHTHGSSAVSGSRWDFRIGDLPEPAAQLESQEARPLGLSVEEER
jgi:hypothetical protein